MTIIKVLTTRNHNIYISFSYCTYTATYIYKINYTAIGLGEDVYPEVLVGSKRCKIELLVEQLKLLMTLNLSDCNITNQGAELIATVLLETASLEKLDLSNTMLNTIKVVKINDSLKSISSLKIFRLNNNNIDDDATDSIAVVTCNNCLIEKINLSNNMLSYTGALNITNALKNIKVLDISNNFITSEESIKDLAVALSSCTVLQELNLSQNLLTFTNVLTIAQFFRHHPSLKILDVSDNIISFSSACECIVDILLSVNHTLINLNVCGVNIRPRHTEEYLSSPSSEIVYTKFTLQKLHLLEHSSLHITDTQTKFIKATEICPISKEDVISYYADHIGGIFYNQYHNFAIVIPPGAVSQGECVEIQATASYFGPYKIPDGFYPISSYYWLSANYKFRVSVYVIMNHYAKIRSLEDISNLCVLKTRAHDNNDIKEMYKISDGVYFDYEIGYCVLATNHFCSYCEAKEDRDIPEFLSAHYCTYDDPDSESFIAEVSFCPSNSECRKVTVCTAKVS